MSQMTFFYDNPEIADKHGWLFVELNYMMVWKGLLYVQIFGGVNIPNPFWGNYPVNTCCEEKRL